MSDPQSEAKLPIRPNMLRASDLISLRGKKGETLMRGLACPRCKTVGSTFRVKDKLDMGRIKLDLPFFECAQCATRWYDYTEMLAYIMARNQLDQMKDQEPTGPPMLPSVDVKPKG